MLLIKNFFKLIYPVFRYSLQKIRFYGGKINYFCLKNKL